MSRENVIIFICRSYQSAEKAVNALQAAHFNVKILSILGKDHLGYIDAVNSAASDAKRNPQSEMFSFWNRMWRLLSRDAFINVEGIGFIIVAGPMAESMPAAWTSPRFFQTTNPLEAGLRVLGIAKEDTARYASALQEECLLLIVQGKPAEVLAAVHILKSRRRKQSDRKQPVEEVERVHVGHNS
jgi:hypothetical protein